VTIDKRYRIETSGAHWIVWDARTEQRVSTHRTEAEAQSKADVLNGDAVFMQHVE
jgi:hypothetical protein